MSWPLPDHDRQADSQSGAGETAHQLIVPLYFQRPVAGPRWYSTVPCLLSTPSTPARKADAVYCLGLTALWPYRLTMAAKS
jgi:hypothetical protein